MRPPASERPSRIRKPAQRDSRIISWSEAVDTIQSLDPVLHAEMLEDNKRMKAQHRSFDYTGTVSNPGKGFSVNRPRISESANEYQPNNSGRTLNDLAEPESLPESMAVEASPTPDETKVRAPCPHADCALYGTIMYRLQRLDNEDLSEMCLHLFRVHHTTPFPCGELGCKRKGEDGFFMQADLVKHVGTEHPNAGAFQRLRGRVDSELLDRNSRPLKNMSTVVQIDSPANRARDSDFMSTSKRNDARITSNSRPFSSSSDHERTRRGTTGILGASTSTPMTSVSSLKANRSSGVKFVMREVSESQESLISDELAHESMKTSSWADQVPMNLDDMLAPAVSVTPTSREPLTQGPALSRNNVGPNVLPTPLASTWDSPRHEVGGHSAYRETPKSIPGGEPDAGRELQLSKHPSSSAMPTASGSQLPPPRKSINSQRSLDKGQTSSLPEQRNEAPSNKTSVSQPIPRNGLDHSYEFSDEEIGIEPIPKALPPRSKEVSIAAPQPTTQDLPTTSARVPPAVLEPMAKSSPPTPATKPPPNKSVAQSNTKTSIATPANQRKSMLQHVLDDDYDELSLGADDFVFMFSRPRNDALPSSNVLVKQEDSAETPQVVSSVPARKRKLSMLRAGSDDELCAIGPSPPSQHPRFTISKPDIKTEEDDTDLPPLLPTKSKVGEMRVRDAQTESSSSKSKHQARQKSSIQSATRSTPLLDLAPSGNKPNHPNDGREIFDSAAESSPPNRGSSPSHPRHVTRVQNDAAGTSSPLTGLLTPLQRKRWPGNPTKGEQVTVVVKTPGGTLRRCGDGAFKCGRSFCFRCGESGSG
jgi:hypothetical protein